MTDAPLINTNPLAQLPDTFIPEIILVQNGWTAQLKTIQRGDDEVLQIYSWVGGFGVKPPLGYISSVGITPFINLATNIKGASAYQIWLASGNTGSISDFINSLTPPPVLTTDINNPLVRRIGNTLYNIIDPNTKELLTFSKVTATDADLDDVIILKKGAEYFKRNFDGGINVRWFGAVGDNVNDDTIPIQNAFNSAAKNGYYVFASNGQFKITANITLPINCVLDGISKEKTTFNFYNSSGLIIQSDDYKSSCTVKSISLISNDHTGNAITFNHASINRVTDVSIINFGIGIYSNNGILNRIDNFFVYNCDIGMQFESESNFNTIFNGSITEGRIGIYSNQVSKIVLNGVDIEATKLCAIWLKGEVSMTDIHIEAAGAVGILLDGYYPHCTARNLFIIVASAAIKQGDTLENGNFIFDNVSISATSGSYDIDAPSLQNYMFTNIVAHDISGAIKTVTKNIPSTNGIYQTVEFVTNGERMLNLEYGRLSIKKQPVIFKKNSSFVTSVEFGTVPANSTFEVVVTTPNLTDIYSDNVIIKPILFNYPKNLVFDGYLPNSTNNKVAIRVMNVSAQDVVLGTQYVSVIII